MCSPRKRKEYNIKHQQLIQLTRTAVLAALTAIATMVIPIPIPGGGYANAGDIVILITAFLLGPLPAAGLVPNLLQGTAGVAGALVLMPALERTFRLLERTRSPQGGASLVCSPSGDLIAMAGDGEELLLAEVDLPAASVMRRAKLYTALRRKEYYL